MLRLKLCQMACLAIVFVAALPGLGWQDTSSRAPISIPVPDHVSPSVRAARNTLYASVLHGVRSSLSQPPGAPPSITVVHGTALPELPVGISQVVVIGKITTITPWLVTGGKGLYSEYRVDVSSVLKNRSSWLQGGTLDLIELGGYAQMADGSTVAHRVSGLGHQIETGKEYLLFLNYQAAADCFTSVKLWEVSNGQLLAVSNDDLERLTQNTSMVNGLRLEDVVKQIQTLVSALGK